MAEHLTIKESRVLVIDDQPVVLAGLTRVINGQNDLVCCGEASNIARAREAFDECQPDVVTVDLGLPDGNGVEFVEELANRKPSVPILVISGYDESLYAERVLKAGARGYVMKECAVNEIVSAIRSVLNGELYVSQKIATMALQQMAGKKPKDSEHALDSLTNRELEVFQMLGSGMGSRAVATKLKLSIKTVETHRENIKDKLGIRDAAGLVHFATRWVESQNRPS